MFGNDNKRPWADIHDLTEADVAAFFSKNDAVNQCVPLAICEQIKDEVMVNMSRATQAQGMDLARFQGQLMALKRFARIYKQGIEQAAKWRRAGGK